MHRDPLFFGFDNFFIEGGHFFSAAAIHDENFFRPFAHCTAHHVDGNISSADDCNAITEGTILALINISQIVHPVSNPFQVFSFDSQFHAFLGAHTQENRFESLVEQIIYGELRSDRGIGLYC